MTPSLKFGHERQGPHGTEILPVGGTITLDTINAFEIEIRKHLRAPSKLTLDCQDVVRIDKSGQSMLMKIRQDYPRSMLRLINVRPSLRSVTELLERIGIAVEYQPEIPDDSSGPRAA